MMVEKYLKAIMKIIIFMMLRIESGFGLSSVSPKSFMFYPLVALKVTFLILYPFVSIEISKYSRQSNLQNGVPVSYITINAKNLLFLLNWLFLLFVYISECQNLQPSKIFDYFLNLLRIQSLRENIFTLLRCSLKFLVVDVILIKFNYDKFVHWKKDELTLLESVSNLPFIIVALASNRIYIANTIVNQYLKVLS